MTERILWACAGMLALASACEAVSNDEAAPFRAVVQEQLRNPSSAEFRNETVRTIWTKQGDRRKVYCAEVNAENAFGGMTGFRPMRYVIEASQPPRDFYLDETGRVDTYNYKTAQYILDCERADTERSHKDFWTAFMNLSKTEEEARMNAQQIAVLSQESAPELRP